jgi:undecaprenyl-diphosphatase
MVSTTLRSTTWKRLNGLELWLCVLFNRPCQWPKIQNFFAVISRLGDGVFWYTLMIALPCIYGSKGILATLNMAAVGGIGLLVYKYLKSRMLRPRPFTVHAGIRLGTAPLDWYSFPSGHTLHAVAFSIVVVSYYPELAWLVVPFSLLVALSRMVLGLHYPSDVLAGAAIGSVLALTSLTI